MRDKMVRLSNQIRDERYPGCALALVAGSFIRGGATKYSDIDLVVVYNHLPNAYRESFVVQGIPVEAFVHDPQTLRYFIEEVDRPSGIPALLQMIKEGVEVPESTTLSTALKADVASMLAQGPPKLTEQEHRTRRYYISDLIDELRDPRTVAELVATGVRLYEVLADYYLRANGYWSGKAKWIPTALEAAADPCFCRRFDESFQALFQESSAKAVIEFTEEILGPHGGLLFDGYRLDAPQHWRKT